MGNGSSRGGAAKTANAAAGARHDNRKWCWQQRVNVPSGLEADRVTDLAGAWKRSYPPLFGERDSGVPLFCFCSSTAALDALIALDFGPDAGYFRGESGEAAVGVLSRTQAMEFLYLSAVRGHDVGLAMRCVREWGVPADCCSLAWTACCASVREPFEIRTGSASLGQLVSGAVPIEERGVGALYACCDRSGLLQRSCYDMMRTLVQELALDVTTVYTWSHAERASRAMPYRREVKQLTAQAALLSWVFSGSLYPAKDEMAAASEIVEVATLVLQLLVDNGCVIDISNDGASHVAGLIRDGHTEIASLYCQLLELCDQWGARMRYGSTFPCCAEAVAFFAGFHHRSITVEQLKLVPYMRRVVDDAKMKQLLENGKQYSMH